jgi:hypothetical protein
MESFRIPHEAHDPARNRYRAHRIEARTPSSRGAIRLDRECGFRHPRQETGTAGPFGRTEIVALHWPDCYRGRPGVSMPARVTPLHR